MRKAEGLTEAEIRKREKQRIDQARKRAEELEYDRLVLAPKPKASKTVYATYPVFVGSSAMYYHTDWLTQNEFYTLKSRYGKVVVDHGKKG